MKDAIYREDAINSVLRSLNKEEYRSAWESGVIKKLKCTLEQLPSVDRPQGEWIDIGTISHSYKCSVCGRTLFHITVGKNHVAKYYPYCHCGAKMRGVDNEYI